MDRGLLWFRTDLRLEDNLALWAAMETCEQLVPVYILEEKWLEEDQWGFRRTGSIRLKFILESLQDLKSELQKRGSDLIVKRGRTEELLPHLCRAYDCHQVFCSKAYTYEEIQIEQALENHLEMAYFHNHPLVHPDDLPFTPDQLPRVFTAFRKKVEKYSTVRAPLACPEAIPSPELEDSSVPGLQDLGYEAPPSDPRAVVQFMGGAKAGRKRLKHYFWDTEKLSEYKETRNGLIGADYSSKFSAWLAQGCLSARSIYAAVEQYEARVTKNQSTYWMKFELLWRDFFLFTAMRYGKKIFLPGGIQDKPKEWSCQARKVQDWIDGKTGDAFVDANMKELKRTGFMSNRGRQNVASYLVHQLKQDWRVGAAWFESQLIDYDVTSNYGNWIYAAGVGNDPRDRVFNTRRQAERYDGDGAYRKLWNDADA